MGYNLALTLNMSANETVDLSKEKDSEGDMGRRTEFVQELVLRTGDSHKRYGEMWVLMETERMLITLGPDYICFLITFVGFAVADYFLVSFVNETFDQLWLKIGNCLFAVVHLLSYLSVAVSNPGIVLDDNLPSQQSQDSDTEPTIRYCLKCKIRMQRNVRHCKRCNVCIRDYDHHCPWVSKCIGGGNMKRFCFFVSLTPIYIMYFMVMIMISSALVLESVPATKH